MIMMNQTHFSLVLVALSILSLVGCASNQATQIPRHSKNIIASQPIYKGNIKTRLNSHLKSWRGTPYKYGGLNKRGIDCSGFVYVTYRDVFGRRIPRSTKLLAGIGRDIPKRKLRIGDLVFFKTGFRQKHVGIYIGKGKFIHASTSKGVITSQLSSSYWASHYWKSIHIG